MAKRSNQGDDEEPKRTKRLKLNGTGKDSVHTNIRPTDNSPEISIEDVRQFVWYQLGVEDSPPSLVSPPMEDDLAIERNQRLKGPVCVLSFTDCLKMPSLVDLKASTDLQPAHQHLVRLGTSEKLPNISRELLFKSEKASKNSLKDAQRKSKKTVKNRIKKYKKDNNTSELKADFYVLDEESIQSIGIPPSDCDGPNSGDFSCPVEKVVCSRDSKDPSLGTKMYAIDCEMCLTTKGRELTRVTLVDEKHKIVYDTHVLPYAPIVDYCTQYSGITKESLQGCKTRLSNVQAELLKMVDSKTILAGHSIENDLQVLKFHHKMLIDTTFLYPHPNGPPYKPSLKFLSKKYLGMEIQNSSSGHCSAEDSIATMKLVQLKVRKGPNFPAVQRSKPMAAQRWPLFRALNPDERKRSVVIDTPTAASSLTRASTVSAIPCISNDSVVKSFITTLTSRVQSNVNDNTGNGIIWGQCLRPGDGEIEDSLRKVCQAFASIPPEFEATLIILFSRDSAELRKLHRLRTSQQNPDENSEGKETWSQKDQEMLKNLAKEVNKGQVLIFQNPSQ